MYLFKRNVTQQLTFYSFFITADNKFVACTSVLYTLNLFIITKENELKIEPLSAIKNSCFFVHFLLLLR